MFAVATSDNVDHEDHSTPTVANSNYGTAMTSFQINKILQQKERILSQNQWNSVLALATQLFEEYLLYDMRKQNDGDSR